MIRPRKYMPFSPSRVNLFLHSVACRKDIDNVLTLSKNILDMTLAFVILALLSLHMNGCAESSLSRNRIDKANSQQRPVLVQRELDKRV